MKTARDVVPMIRIVELRRERKIGILAVEVIPSGDGFVKDPSGARGLAEECSENFGCMK